MRVKNLNKGIKIGRIGKIGNIAIYFIIIHPELNIWQNILLNCGVPIE